MVSSLLLISLNIFLLSEHFNILLLHSDSSVTILRLQIVANLLHMLSFLSFWYKFLSGQKSSFFCNKCCILLEEVIQQMGLPVDSWAGLKQWTSPRPLLCPWNKYILYASPSPGAISRTQPWESMVLLDHLDCVQNWTLLRFLHKSWWFWQKDVEI